MTRTDAAVRRDWTGRLHTRERLVVSARRAHIIHHNAKTAAHLAKRKTQVAYAHRVIARHLPGGDTRGVSDRGLALVAGFEGFRSRPYRDIGGVWTIGFGETRKVGPGMAAWTRAYALARLRVRINRDYLRPVIDVAEAVGLKLTTHERDALASLVYNLGPGILAPGRSMGDALRSRSRTQIANAFLVYDKVGGWRVAGLTARRRMERALFLTR